MGAYLSAPITEKSQGSFRHNLRGAVSAYAEMQGWRNSMEDAHSIRELQDGSLLFGVFDGHGGAEVAKFAAEHMHEYIQKYSAGELPQELEQAFFKCDTQMRSSEGKKELKLYSKDGGAEKAAGGRKDDDAMKRVLAMMLGKKPEDIQLQARPVAEGAEGTSGGGDSDDESVSSNSEVQVDANGHDTTGGFCPGYSAGATAVVAVVTANGELVVANAGDSRCVLSRGGKAVDMSDDHKPDDVIEKTRIEKAGGFVTAECRVCGNLNLSRALGDFEYKRNRTISDAAQIISAQPDIKIESLQDKDEFMILACDGIWNSMDSQQAIDFVRTRLAGQAISEELLKQISAELCDACMHQGESLDGTDGTGCDNETVVLVQFKPVPKK